MKQQYDPSRQLQFLFSKLTELFANTLTRSLLHNSLFTIQFCREIASSVPLLAAYDLYEYITEHLIPEYLNQATTDILDRNKIEIELSVVRLELEAIIYEMEKAGYHMNENRFYRQC